MSAIDTDLATTLRERRGAVDAAMSRDRGRLLGLYGENSAAGFIASVIGAVIVLFIYNLVSKKA